MAASPWIKFFTSDFLTGVADLEADEIGVYTVILALIWDRGAPIADDPSWLARRAGTSTRRFNQIKARLVTLGKLQLRGGMIGNARALAEVARRDGKSEQARNAALQRWHADAEPELELGENSQIISGKSGTFSEDKNVLKSRKSDQKPQKTANEPDADAFSLSRARAVQSPESRSRIERTNESVPAPPRVHAREAAFASVCEAAGFTPTTDQQRNQAKAFLASWERDGLSLEADILPTIRRVVAESDDPTSSLKRFDRHMRHARAKAGATPPAEANGTPAPVRSIGRDDPDDERLTAIRTTLRSDLGPKRYDSWLKAVTLSIAEDRLTLTCPSEFHASHVRTEFDHRIRTIAKTHDLKTVTITTDLTD